VTNGPLNYEKQIVRVIGAGILRNRQRSTLHRPRPRHGVHISRPLNNNGTPASGSYDVEFTLYATNLAGSPVADPINNSPVTASNGLFVVTLDFGAGVFTGPARWLEIGARSNTVAVAFTTLSPRQQLTPALYAIMANSASNLLGALPAAQLSGTIPLAQLPGAVLTNNESSVTLANLTLNGALNFPATTAGPDIIHSGSALLLYSDGNGNFFSGQGAGNLTMSAVGNTAIGNSALVGNTTGSGNTANGRDALDNNTSGSDNTASGSEALFNNATGNNNIALGYQAGANLTTGSYNIDIGSSGIADENKTIRIGTQGTQTAIFIAGISGATAASGVAVFVNSSGQLGTFTSSRRFKDDIQGMDQASDVFYALKPVTFKYTPGLDPKASDNLAW
jgi:hypothetical protein